MCRSVRQTSRPMLPLLTQQYYNGYLVKSAADVLNSPPRDIPGKVNGCVHRDDLKTQDST